MGELIAHNHNQEMCLMPKPPDIYRRDKSIPPEIPYFSTAVRDIAIVPLRAEFTNNHLAEYLTIMNRQQPYHEGQKFGLVFLVNDHASDKNNERVSRENSLTSDYLSSLARKELPPDDLAIPQNYRDIAEKIIENDALEIRVDYVHSELDSPHYGTMPLHLLHIASGVKNPETAPNDTLIHLHNIDMRMRRTHFSRLTEFYQENPNMRINISEFDLSPGIHEDVENESQNISQELLLHLDDYRLYQYGKLVRFFIVGLAFSGTPTLSGRYSYFFPNGRLNRLISYTLEGSPYNEDYHTSNIMKKSNEHEEGAVGYNEEVLFLHRARTSNASAREAQSGPDGEEIYAVITQKAFKGKGFKRDYDLVTEGDMFIEDLEEQIAKTDNKAAIRTGHTPDFLREDSYQKILGAEVKTERAKIKRRRDRLLNYIKFGTELDPDDISAPFIQNFPNETAYIHARIGQGHLPEQIAEVLMEKYNSFFDPDAKIHTQIARLRALKKYTFTFNISLIDHSKEQTK